MDQPAPETTRPAAACPRCGTPYAPSQEYCLECGGRLPGHGVVANLSAGWRRRFPWYPGDWIWPVLVALVVALIATGVVLAATWDSGGGSTIVATGPASTPSATTAPTTASTGPVTIPEPTPPAAPQPPPSPPPSSGPIDWPAGRNGFTVVLESIPATRGRGEALATARAALRSGLRNVGVLDSSRYSSLHPGYYVVFSGIYASNVDATSAASSAKASGYADAYPATVTS
jgi:hypothetical protein